MRFARPLAVWIILFAALSLRADQVTPKDSVSNHVRVRETASGSSDEVGRLLPGQRAEVLASIPHWFHVRLANGTEGFVSKVATTLVAADPSSPDFQIHFLDVGTGDSAIIDMGDREIVIDGGDSIRVLDDYARRHSLIDGPIELVVVTHGDSDHWKGLTRLLGFDGRNAVAPRVLEFWDPGYDRDCRPLPAYTKFISDMKALPGIRFLRPLETTHAPAVITGKPQPFTLPSLPGVSFTLLHSAAAPEASNGDCAYRINNASIAMRVEIAGFRFLFMGDANGKERDEASPGTPGHVEEKLLNVERAHPGTLKADVLKVPHHGSETASTQAFIDAVDPAFVVFSASTKHHLPRETTVRRYERSPRVLLRTDANRDNDVDHIICLKGEGGKLDCNFQQVLSQ